MQRRPLVLAAAGLPLVAQAATAFDPSGSWVATLRHAGESTPIGLRFAPHAEGGWTVQATLPAIHAWNAPFGRARWQDGALQLGSGWQLQPSRDGRRLLGAMPEFLLPRLRLPLVLERGELPQPPRALPDLPPPRTLWRRELGAPLWADLLRAGDSLFASDDAGVLHALDLADGHTRWQARTGGALRCRPLLHQGQLLVPSDDGLLHAFEAGSGAPVWQLPLQDQPVRRIPPGQPGARFDRFGAGVALQGEALLTASHAGRLACWQLGNAPERRLRWQADIGHSLLGTPVIAGGLVVLGAFDGSVRAFELASGRERWRFETGAPVVSAVWVEDGLVLVGSRSYELFALRLADGAEAWRRYHWFSWVESAVNGLDGLAYLGSSDGAHLSCWAPRTGRLVWRRDVHGWAWGSPALDAQRVAIGTSALPGYTVGHEASVWSFERRSGRPHWRAPLAAPASPATYGVTGSLALAPGQVFAATLGGELLAFAD
ncbi:PQQ-binding-like beta-propeller repeat protein [Inhella sp.]|uniref:outer membrane protein assembly factor BamB family protein n=1 Tax=Inhella sp. TaxID=1921806 RepID=UPI0035AF3A9C